MRIFGILALVLLSLNVCGQNQETEKKWEMKTYYMVFLKKGPNRTQDSATSAQIQQQHLAHIEKMYNEKRLCMAGPFLADGDIRGICVYTVNTQEEAERWAKEDPAVKAGRLIVEVHPWYAAKGSTLP